MPALRHDAHRRGDPAAAIQLIEVLSEDSEGFLRVVFVRLRSLTAKSRNERRHTMPSRARAKAGGRFRYSSQQELWIGQHRSSLGA